MSTKVENYTAEQAEALESAYSATSSYDEGRAVIAEMAETFGKSVQSVTAKLVNLGVYRAKERTSTRKTVAKADLIDAIEAAVGAEGEMTSLEKVNRTDLARLVEFITS